MRGMGHEVLVGAVRLSATDAPEVVAVLAEAFRDYPVMRFVLGVGDNGDDADHDARLRTLIGFFMIGVRGAHRGDGLGRLLLHAVHDHARERPGCRGVSLTTENPANVPLYQYFGYDLVAHAEVAPGLESWGFFRRIDAADDSRRAR